MVWTASHHLIALLVSGHLSPTASALTMPHFSCLLSEHIILFNTTIHLLRLYPLPRVPFPLPSVHLTTSYFSAKTFFDVIFSDPSLICATPYTSSQSDQGTLNMAGYTRCQSASNQISCPRYGLEALIILAAERQPMGLIQ